MTARKSVTTKTPARRAAIKPAPTPAVTSKTLAEDNKTVVPTTEGDRETTKDVSDDTVAARRDGGTPGVNAEAPQTADGELDARAASNPLVGIDPRATDDLNALNNAAGRVVAAPPTPTVETAKTANDEPGAGGHPLEAPQTPDANAVAAVKRRPSAKDVEMVSVTVPRAFILNDDGGVKHNYGPGVQDMPRSHAEHYYAAANGVEINE